MSKEVLGILEVAAALEKADGSRILAAQLLGVTHVTLWRFMKKHMSDDVVTRRPATHVDELPAEVCLDIYKRVILKKMDIHDVADFFAFSLKATRKAVQKGRKLHAAQSRTGSSSHRDD